MALTLQNNSSSSSLLKLTSPKKNPFKKLISKARLHKSSINSFNSINSVDSVNSAAYSDSTNETVNSDDYSIKIKKKLFSLKDSEIKVFTNSDLHSIKNNINLSNKSDFLSKGSFQIYQLITNKTNYLICGSVIHPIFPSSKIIKISFNCFVIPIKNPDRYWKLTLNTNDKETLNDFELVISKICVFKNEYIEDNDINDCTTTDLCEYIDSHKSNSLSSAKSSFQNDSVTLKTFIHIDSDDDLDCTIVNTESICSGDTKNDFPILLQPIPIRPNSSTSFNNNLNNFSVENYSDFESNFESELDIEFQLESDLVNDLIDANWMDISDNSKSLTNRYSLTFKDIEVVPVNKLMNYSKNNLRNIIKENSNVNLLSRFLIN